MKQRLDDKSLDRFPGTKSKRGKEYPFLKARNWRYNGTLELYNDNWREDMPEKIYDNDWIPSKLASLVLGVSKQAISDRIKRKTIESREGRFGTGVKLVRLMDCRKKKKAGRPKGSTAAKVKELNREGFEIPVYFKCIASLKEGCTKTMFHKQVNGHIYEFTDKNFTQEIPDPYRDTIPMTEAAMSGNIESKRDNTYYHRHGCTTIEIPRQEVKEFTEANHQTDIDEFYTEGIEVHGEIKG